MAELPRKNAPDWLIKAANNPQRDPSLGFHLNHDDKREHEERLDRIMENHRLAQEAALQTAKLKSGGPIPPPMAPADSIKLEFAMASDTATVRLEYLVDPYLPAKCVVGFFGRGSTSKSSLLATISAHISSWASTLWISVEEPDDWIKVRHNGCGGAEKTLAIVTAVETKRDAQGRVIGSTFNIYEHLEVAIEKAKAACALQHVPPRPLRLVVLDTVVGLTTWNKGESANDDGGVKRLLAYLQALAEKHDLTIAMVGHANKGKHDHFADVVMGASAWTNSPRLSFVHAKDEREDYAYVLRIAKTNLVTFGASYKTEPVHTLYERADGPDSVLVRVVPGPIVWGDADSMELWNEATRKPKDGDEDGGGGSHKQTLVDKALGTVVEIAHSTGEPVTRDLVHQWLGREVSRREWSKVDDKLRLGEFQWRVVIESGPQNKTIYRKRTD
jgi:AAA domain